ncbi:hypothetical protein YT1_1409 [Rhodococcus ruber]|nr:hypothetical protein YT1_1409 [Rhodococcus ruber]
MTFGHRVRPARAACTMSSPGLAGPYRYGLRPEPGEESS